MHAYVCVDVCASVLVCLYVCCVCVCLSLCAVCVHVCVFVQEIAVKRLQGECIQETNTRLCRENAVKRLTLNSVGRMQSRD